MAWEPDYVTEDQLKTELGIPLTDELEDARIAIAVTAGSRAVDEFAGPGGTRQFGQVDAAEERTYEVLYIPARRFWRATIDDIQDLTDLVVELDGVALSASQYTLYPRNAVQRGQAYTQISLSVPGCEVAITGLWGWSAVPVAVVQATLTQASRFFKRKDSPFGVAGSPSTGGSEMRLQAKIDPDVAVGLKRYRRYGSVG